MSPENVNKPKPNTIKANIIIPAVNGMLMADLLLFRLNPLALFILDKECTEITCPPGYYAPVCNIRML